MGLNSHTGLMRLGLKYAPGCTSSSCHRRALAACCAGVAPFRCDLHLCTLSSTCRSGCLLSAPPKNPDGEAADGQVHGLTVRNDRELVRRRQLDPWQRAWPRVQAVARIFAPTLLRIPACRGRLTENVCAIPYSSIMQQITMPGAFQLQSRAAIIAKRWSIRGGKRSPVGRAEAGYANLACVCSRSLQTNPPPPGCRFPHSASFCDEKACVLLARALRDLFVSSSCAPVARTN
ncbi:hypothetical protein L1887_59451 [Cichorium endivia]|nr:hypothetical protein L1887_59451 [Cichorium endivia]